VCVDLCVVFRLIVVSFCVMCVICVLCLIVVPLPPGENPFVVKINNNNNLYLKLGLPTHCDC
jgi:type IV secretory pathway component VirB8